MEAAPPKKKKQPYPFWLGGTSVCLSGVLLDGTNGVVVPHEDPAAIAQAIRDLEGQPRAVATGTSTWAEVAVAYRALAQRLAAVVAA